MQHKAVGPPEHPSALFALVKADGGSHESQAFLFSLATNLSHCEVTGEITLTVREYKTNRLTV